MDDTARTSTVLDRLPRALPAAGAVATVAGALITFLAAVLVHALGVDFYLPEDDQTIPLAGFAVVTAGCAVAGTLLAAALRRWTGRPAWWFVRVTVVLTVLSTVPALASGAAAGTTTALVLLHLLAAVVVIPILTRALATGPDS